MKTTTILTIILLLNFSIYASVPNLDVNGKNSSQEAEFVEILNEVLDVQENKFISEIKPKNRIIIIDESFNTIREESIDDVENISNQSMLVPTIYRSQFIATVHNVSYYMLEKK